MTSLPVHKMTTASLGKHTLSAGGERSAMVPSGFGVALADGVAGESEVPAGLVPGCTAVLGAGEGESSVSVLADCEGGGVSEAKGAEGAADGSVLMVDEGAGWGRV